MMVHGNAPTGALFAPGTRSRRTGRWGATARAVCGATLVVLAVTIWEAGWLDLLIGLVALPLAASCGCVIAPRRR
jgi:hypothetical protein